jgi:hypothetical protein
MILFARHPTIYNLFLSVYDKTDSNLRPDVLDYITTEASKYGSDFYNVDLIISILYFTMVAEENKKYTKLGKRIKRLGIYNMVKDGFSVDKAASFSQGLSWRAIDSLCKERGF